MSIEIRRCKPQKKTVTGQHQTVEETHYVPEGPIYVIRGTGYPEGKAPKGFPRRPEMVGSDAQSGDEAFALTPNVDAEWFAGWLDENKETAFVKHGLIKAAVDLDSLADECSDLKKVHSGFQPLNMEDDKPDERIPPPMSSSITGVARWDRT